MKEIRPNSENMCGVHSKDDMIEDSLDEPLVWNPVDLFIKGQSQSEETFREQKFAIKICIYAIDKYRNILINGTFTNNVGI